LSPLTLDFGGKSGGRVNPVTRRPRRALLSMIAALGPRDAVVLLNDGLRTTSIC
jgi:hypothetical protein